MGSNVGENVKEVRRGVNAIDDDDGRDGGSAVMFTSRAGAIKRTGVVPGIVRTIEKVLDDLVGGGNVELINIIKL